MIWNLNVAVFFVDMLTYYQLIVIIKITLLSIDSRTGRRERRHKIHFISSEKDISDFLEELQGILLDRSFDINRDLYMILTAKNKITLLDRGDSNPPLLYVFGKRFNDKCMYIKIKIKGEVNNKVLCLSFHYAEYDLKYPYA